MHKSATKCNETIGKWCKNKHGASKIIDTLKSYHSSCTRCRQAGEIYCRSLQTPTAFVVDSDAIRYPATRFLHLLDSSLPRAPPHHFGLPQEAPEWHPCRSPEPPEANAASNRLPSPCPEAIEVGDHVFEIPTLPCTSS
jgi:hypothetical protein